MLGVNDVRLEISGNFLRYFNEVVHIFRNLFIGQIVVSVFAARMSRETGKIEIEIGIGVFRFVTKNRAAAKRIIFFIDTIIDVDDKTSLPRLTSSSAIFSV